MRPTGLILLMVALLASAPASQAASVTHIVGTHVAAPVLGVGSASIVCTPPAWCPTFFDNHQSIAGRYYGDAFSSGAGLSNNCRISTDNGGTWTTLCAGAYPTANIPREMDVTHNNVLLSLRYESTALNLCQLDRSVDDGASWTTVTVAAGAGINCLGFNSGYLFERLRCSGGSCLAMVNNASASVDIYRSNDEGQTWFLAKTGVAFFMNAELFYRGSFGVFSYVSGGDDTLTSTDGGFSWTIKSGNVAATTNCGGVTERLSVGLGSIGIGCLASPTTSFTILNGAATLGFTPTQPSGYTYFADIGVALRSRQTGHLYFTGTTTTPTRGRLFVSTNGGSVFTEMSASVSGAIDPIGNHCARDSGRNLIFSTNGNTFSGTQMILVSGGE